MIDTAPSGATLEPIGPRLQAALRSADRARGEGAALLRQLLSSGAPALPSDQTIARVGGLLHDLARRLIAAAEGDEALVAELAGQLALDPALLRHVEALCAEWRLAEALEARIALDPVATRWLARAGGEAERLIEAQARFAQAMQRMELPPEELPRERLRGVLAALRAVAGLAEADGEARSASAEAAIRARREAQPTRRRLLRRWLAEGSGGDEARSLETAGVAVFLSAIAIAAGEDRDAVALATQEPGLVRLALALRAAGAGASLTTAQLALIEPDGDRPHGLVEVDGPQATALLAHARREAG